MGVTRGRQRKCVRGVWGACCYVSLFFYCFFRRRGEGGEFLLSF